LTIPTPSQTTKKQHPDGCCFFVLEDPNGLDAVDLNENNNAFVSINRNAVGTISNLYIS